MNSKFGKQYKLCSKTTIEQLYQSGREIKCFPFYLKYTLTSPKTAPFQVVFVVPKKKFKLATTRNKIRRYIREAFRLEKNQLETKISDSPQSLALFLVYAGDEHIQLPDARKNMAKLIKKLIQDLEQNEIK